MSADALLEKSPAVISHAAIQGLDTFVLMRDSGVAWLGTVPGHWHLEDTRRNMRREKQLNTGMACTERLSLTMSGVVPRELDDLNGLQASEFSTYQIFNQGDLVFKLLDLQNIKTSRVGMVPCRGIMSPAYIRLVVNGMVLSKYAFWYFTNMYNLNIFNNMGDGVRQTIGQDELLGIKFLRPPVDEQHSIAAFLDRETAKIDALIAEQERLLALLTEKRQAVISRTVTQGLDLSVPMKDSGVEWLGRMPEHWKVARIGHYASVENGSTPSRADLGYWDDGDIAWVGSGEVNQYVVTEPTEYITARAVRECSLRILPEGAVLVGLIGQGRTRAMSALLGIAAAINQNVAAVTTRKGLLAAYLHYSLQAAYEFMRECARGGNQAALNCEILKAFRIAIPPVDEQESIVRNLERVHASTARLMAECETSIGLLRERRAALISAAVTGKIDVRGLVPTIEPAREAA